MYLKDIVFNMIQNITSVQNQYIKNIAKLSKSRERKKQQKTIIEGFWEVREAFINKYPIIDVLVCKDSLRIEEEEFFLQLEAAGVNIIYVSEHVMEKISYRSNPDKWASLVKTEYKAIESIQVKNDSLFVVCEALEKPGNIGAIIRSAEAVGADAVILTDTVTDMYNPNVIRASKGTVFSVPVIVCSNDELKDFCETNNISIFVGTPEATIPYYKENYSQASVIIVGNEHNGVSPYWRKNVNIKKIGIPMHGSINSLNVAQAASILLFEALKQRAE